MSTGKIIFWVVIAIAVILLIVFLARRSRGQGQTSGGGMLNQQSPEQQAITISKRAADLLETGQPADAATAQNLIAEIRNLGFQYMGYGQVKPLQTA